MPAQPNSIPMCHDTFKAVFSGRGCGRAVAFQDEFVKTHSVVLSMEEAGTRDSKVHAVLTGFGDRWGFSRLGRVDCKFFILFRAARFADRA